MRADSRMAEGLRGGTSLSVAVLFVCFCALVVTVLFSPGTRLVALAAVIPAVSIAVGVSRIRTGNFNLLEVFFPFSALYFLYFGIGAVYLWFRPVALPSIYLRNYLFPALGVAVAGYLAFTFAYVGLRSRPAKNSRLGAMVPRGSVAVWLPALGGFAGAIAAVLQQRAQLQEKSISVTLSTIQQFLPLFLFAWALAWSLFFGNTGSRRQRWLNILGLLPMAFMIAFLTIGGKALFLTLAGIPVLSYSCVRRSLPVKTLVAIILVGVFLVFPLYNTFRFQSRKADVTQRIEGTLRTAGRWDQDDYMARSLFAFFDRMAVVSSVAAIVRETGRWQDYQYGRTLMLTPLTLLIPRFLWPEKPKITIGREFGEKFNLVNPVDKETQIAPTFVGEFYWNFGLPGVLLGMYLVGLGYRWFYSRYGDNGEQQPIRVSLYLTLLVAAMQFEGNLAICLGVFVKSLVIVTTCVAVLERMGYLTRPGAPGLTTASGF